MRAGSAPCASSLEVPCTNTGHLPVDRLHLIEKKQDKATNFSLTLKIEGVKRESFFDNFLSFSGWCGVRGSSAVTFSIAK
jgi:hypothetical protein